MDEQPSYEALMKLIDDVITMRPPKRDMCFHTANTWKYELSLHPDRFRLEGNELLWLGSKVCVIGSKQNQNKFWRMVNNYMSDGIIE